VRLRRKPSNFHVETFVCSVKGHVAPAAAVGELGEGDGDLGVDLPDGRRLARCIRCDAWVAGSVPTGPGAPSLPPEDELEHPRKGKELRQAIILRLIAIDRALHSIAFGLLAVALIVLDLKLGGVQHWAQDLRDRLSTAVTESGRQPSRGVLVDSLDRVLKINKHGFPVLIGTAIAYCVVEGVEAVGLWLEKRWAEYLTAVATAGFLPFEIHELTKRMTAFRVGALVVNIAVLVYLVWSKRLFGVRGGASRSSLDRPADSFS